MNEEARLNEELYKTFIESEKNKPKVEEKKISKIVEKVEELKLNQPQSSNLREGSETKDDKKSMEKWLDDILDI